MGGISGVLHTLKNLSRADVACVIRKLFEEHTRADNQPMSQPTMDFDSNNICYVTARKSDSKSVAVAEFYKNWAYCGIEVVPVVDGDVRPTAKQASNSRRADRERSRIEGHILLKEANKIKSDIAQGFVTSDNLAEQQKLLFEKEKESRAKLNKSEDMMPVDFAEALEDALVNDVGVRIPNDSGGFVAPVLKAKFQADAVIVDRFLKKKTLTAGTNDVDIYILCGDQFVGVKEYSQDGKMTLASTCKATLERAQSYLPDESKEIVKFVEAPCAVFEGVESIKLRALMMVALGCDVYSKGISGVGPKTLSKMINKIKEKMDEHEKVNEVKIFWRLLTLVAKMTKLGVSAVDTLVKGIIYEPTNYLSCENATDTSFIATEAEHTYFCGVQWPNILPEYLFDFAHYETSMGDGPQILCCKGVGPQSHLFLSKTGWNRCHGCNGVVCRLCCGAINEKQYCLNCYAAESLVPSKDGGFMGMIATMRQELKERFQYDGADELPLYEVEEVYDNAMKQFGCHKDLEKGVKFPLYATSHLNDTTEWKPIYKIRFSNGGTFIADPALKPHVPSILELFASFVKYEKKKHTEWVKDPMVYDSLPAMIIGFCQNSRIDSGYRLLERCIRHGHDPKMQSLFYNTATIIQLKDGSIGMRIDAKVPASMRDQTFNTPIAHTAKDILSVECDCKAGSKDEDKIVCVHNPPVLYKVTELLLEDLAEHILLELTSCLSALTVDWSHETLSQVKESVFKLMEAAGEVVTSEDKASMTLECALERFLTGTEKDKTWGRGSRSAKLVEEGPIEKLTFTSPAKRAKDLKDENKKKRTAAKSKANDAVNPSITDVLGNGTIANDPQYINTKFLMDAAGIDCADLTPVGFRLLEERCKNQNVSVDEILRLRTNMSQDWKLLCTEAESRSHRIAAKSLSNLSKGSCVEPSETTNNTPAKSTQSTKRKSNVRDDQTTMVTPSPAKAMRPNRASDLMKSKRGLSLPTQPTPPKPPKEVHSRCCRKECTVTNVSHPKTRFHRIPAYPHPLVANTTRKRYIAREGKIVLRNEILDRTDFKRGIKDGAYRVCEEHEFEWVVKSKTLTWNNKSWSQLFNLYVPKGDGPKHPNRISTGDSRGTALDRAAIRQLELLNGQINSKPKKFSVNTEAPSDHSNSRAKSKIALANEKAAIAEAEAAESRKVVQQMAEVSSSDSQQNVKINASVARAAGLPFDSRSSPPVQTPNKTFFNSEPRKTNSTEPKRVFVASKPPIVKPGMDDELVKRWTGFPSEKEMLAYIFVVCQGDAPLIRQRSTPLTWYEEWVFPFEFKWGRKLTRWEDAEEKYGPIAKSLRPIYRQKLSLERRARELWPKFASYEEDLKLRKPKWDMKYREKDGSKSRIIMWDMTGIKAYQFGAADLQRGTFSKYYAGNCFKGGIFTQTCGWLGVWDLWGGNISDTNYNKKAGYLEEQAEFQKEDKVDGNVVPFTNIYDKGYRARAVCHKVGGQLVKQPVYGKSDRRFKGTDTMFSASVASDRGGNERGVNVSKRCGVIKRGYKSGMDAQIYQDTWLTWGFQANFMFNPVL